jgi:hypothetical protein
MQTMVKFPPTLLIIFYSFINFLHNDPVNSVTTRVNLLQCIRSGKVKAIPVKGREGP